MPSHHLNETPPTASGPGPSLEAILTASPYLFCMMDRDGRLLRINAAAEATLGYALEEAAGHCLTTLTHPDDRRDASNAITDAGEVSDGPVELRVECASGRLRLTKWWFSRDLDLNHVLGWGRDVTESRAVREELEVRIGLLQNLIAERTRALAEAETRLEDARLALAADRTGGNHPDTTTSDGRLFSHLPVPVVRVDANP